MRINIQARSFSLTNALCSHIRRRLNFALSMRDEYIKHITVRLTDINGPRGGDDMQCQIQVSLSQLPEVIIEDTNADMYVAIDRAASRAARNVERRISRQQSQLRSTYILPVAVNE